MDSSGLENWGNSGPELGVLVMVDLQLEKLPQPKGTLVVMKTWPAPIIKYLRVN